MSLQALRQLTGRGESAQIRWQRHLVASLVRQCSSCARSELQCTHFFWRQLFTVCSTVYRWHKCIEGVIRPDVVSLDLFLTEDIRQQCHWPMGNAFVGWILATLVLHTVTHTSILVVVAVFSTIVIWCGYIEGEQSPWHRAFWGPSTAN